MLAIISFIFMLGISLASAGDSGNPAQFPYSATEQSDLFYVGCNAVDKSNNCTPTAITCGGIATSDNKILQFYSNYNFGTFYSCMLNPSDPACETLFSGEAWCVSVFPDQPSEVVNSSKHLSSSQKNFIGVQVSAMPCKFFRMNLTDSAAIYAPTFDFMSWEGNVPGLTTGAAYESVAIMMAKLLNSAIANSAGEAYEPVSYGLSAAGFKLGKGYWVNQCFGQPMIFPSTPQ